MTTGTTGRQWAANNLFQAKDGGGGDGAPPPSDPAVWLAGLRLGEAQDLEPYQIHPLCLEEAGPAPQMLRMVLLLSGVTGVHVVPLKTLANPL